MPTDKVLEWLEKTGFPLEMEAAAAFKGAGFDVRQSFTFLDPREAKGREIDVLAQDPDWFGVIEISFVIECKASPNPWVILTSDDALSNYNRLFAFSIMSEAARSALAKRITGLGKLEQYIKRPSRGGYGFRQAFGKESDQAYTATISALTACTSVCKNRESSSIPRIAFAFPVIVIDAPLFECSLGSDGKLHLIKVEQSEFLSSAYLPEQVGCCIKVITRDKLRDFASLAKQLANDIREQLDDEQEKIFPTKDAGYERG